MPAREPVVTVHTGDCADVLKELPDESVDAVVTDPPYGLSNTDPGHVTEALTHWLAGDRRFTPDVGSGFMGSEWDAFVPPPAVWDEVIRVLKPGGHALVFAGTRTVDLMTLSMRLAGFDIRDTISWLHLQGFPKSNDVSKSIDKLAGAERDVVSEGTAVKRLIPGADQDRTGSWIKDSGREYVPTVTAPATEDAKRWSGWGTSLKPAQEPVIVARKPLSESSVARQVIATGTGAVNVDGCRIPTADTFGGGANGSSGFVDGYAGDGFVTGSALGRWPANVVLSHAPDCVRTGTAEVRNTGHHPASRGPGGISTDGHSGQPLLGERSDRTETVDSWRCAPDCQVAALDAQSGDRASGGRVTGNQESRTGESGIYGGYEATSWEPYEDTGGASRMFHRSQLEPSQLDDLPARFYYSAKATSAERVYDADGNGHKTVKPLGLMRWLVRLVSGPGAVVLEPFGGSGTTAEACVLEGFDCVVIEREPEYVELIRQRCRRALTAVTGSPVGHAFSDAGVGGEGADDGPEAKAGLFW